MDLQYKPFVWTTQLNKKLLELRFENDWLFKKKKQPWREFHKMLIEQGFPEEISVSRLRKKWSYMYDTYKIAKKTKDKSWKYYKIFEKHYGKINIFDKYESWNDEWRLKLITCICEAKEHKLGYHNMWRTVEKAMRCLDLPSDCYVQDIKGLWQHIRGTFSRKHRLKIKKCLTDSDWPLYESMLEYYKKFEPDHIEKIETQTATECFSRQRKSTWSKKDKNTDNNDNESEEFLWSKDITETFIQIRLQNDWLFRERKWAWHDLANIMIEEYGFPKTIKGRDIGRKWAATFAEYQKSKATNNKSWVYYNLFELYLGEGPLSLNPIVGWQEEWVFNLISARADLEHLFKHREKDQVSGWRQVEKRLRDIGIPIDHSLLDLPEIWLYLLKTFRWKSKFAKKGLLNEQWPFYEAMSQYSVDHYKEEYNIKEQLESNAHYDDVPDDDYEDDIKLFDLKQRLQLHVKPKFEMIDENQCRCCSVEDGTVNIFEHKDEEEIHLVYKLKIIGGIEVEKSDNFPSLICFNCLRELENAYKFRIVCQETDKNYRRCQSNIKCEMSGDDPERIENTINEDDRGNADDSDGFHDDLTNETSKELSEKKVQIKQKILRKRKKPRKLRYDYWKICEICGKHTRNLISHLDTHSKAKSYSCDICEKKFKFKSGLVLHKAIHNPTPRKTCEVCGKTFHILAQYRRHFVYHANERKYGCETCGKRFNTLDILRVHNRTHTDERPFTCQECGKKFRTAGCVSRHKRIVHRNVKQK